MRDFVAGQKLFNRYTLTKILGRGGMGVVWLAQDDQLERDVALKFVPELIVLDPAVLNELRRETKRSLELTHKNIVRIYDFVRDATSACISMEHIDGGTLSGLRVQKESKVFEPGEIADWVSQLCDALDYAHNHARIIHRDLKPTNLMVNQRGDLKVADFGIARSLSDSVSMLTHARGTSGTLVYMSPQQLDGDRGTHVDDVYSFGATIYELLTSKPPFYSGNIDRQIREKIAPSMNERRKELEIAGDTIPPAWEQVIASCLAKDAARRPQSIAEIASRLESQSSRPSPEVPGKRVKKGLLIGTAVVVLCLIAAAGWYFGFYHQTGQRQPSQAAIPIEKQSGEASGAMKMREPSAPEIEASASPEITPQFSTEFHDYALRLAESAQSAARNDLGGIPEESVFGITEVKVTEAPDPDAQTNLTFRISVKKRPAASIDHTKVKIQVFFYDTENDKEVVLTDADVNYQWITPKHDWNKENPEILQVTYVRPKKKASTGRKYLGYIVRVYYKDQLQAVRGDPAKLLNLFPPPFTAPTQ